MHQHLPARRALDKQLITGRLPLGERRPAPRFVPWPGRPRDSIPPACSISGRPPVLTDSRWSRPRLCANSQGSSSCPWKFHHRGPPKPRDPLAARSRPGAAAGVGANPWRISAPHSIHEALHHCHGIPSIPRPPQERNAAAIKRNPRPPASDGSPAFHIDRAGARKRPGAAHTERRTARHRVEPEGAQCTYSETSTSCRSGFQGGGTSSRAQATKKHRHPAHQQVEAPRRIQEHS